MTKPLVDPYDPPVAPRVGRWLADLSVSDRRALLLVAADADTEGFFGELVRLAAADLKALIVTEDRLLVVLGRELDGMVSDTDAAWPNEV